MNLDDFEKGQWIYLCCHNYGCYNSTVGKGGKTAAGGCQGEVINKSRYLLPVLEWGTKMDVMVMNEDAVPLRDFLLCDEMNAFRLPMRDEMMNLCFVSLVLTSCLRVVTWCLLVWLVTMWLLWWVLFSLVFIIIVITIVGIFHCYFQWN